MVPAAALGGGNEYFQRGVASASAHACQAGIDTDRAVLDSHDGVGDAERQIVMCMHAALRFRLQHPVISLEPGGIFVHVHRAAAIGDVDTVGSGVLHQFGLLRECLGGAHVAHHEEAGDVHPKSARRLDMLL